jgi:hypothetical protein
MRSVIFGVWSAVALLATCVPAQAHESITDTLAPLALPPSLGPEALIAAGPALDSVWLAAVAAVIIAVALARHRRAFAVACASLLLLVAFEAGLHSVHHLTDKPESQCVIASASAHAGALTVDRVTFERPAEAAAPLSVTLATRASVRPAAPDLGRAPPIA